MDTYLCKYKTKGRNQCHRRPRCPPLESHLRTKLLPVDLFWLLGEERFLPLDTPRGSEGWTRHDGRCDDAGAESLNLSLCCWHDQCYSESAQRSSTLAKSTFTTFDLRVTLVQQSGRRLTNNTTTAQHVQNIFRGIHLLFDNT